MGIEDHGSYKEVICDDKSYEAKAVIIATGCEHRKLGVKAKKNLLAVVFLLCAFKNKRLVVVGGGDSAVEEAIYLTQFASEVVIVHRRDELRAKIIQDRAFANEKISFVWDTVVEEIVGNEMVVTGVKARNVKTDEVSEIEANGVFIYVG